MIGSLDMRRVWRESWNIAVFESDPWFLLDVGALPCEVDWLFGADPKVSDADPCLWTDDSGRYIFWERFDHLGTNGHVMAGRLDHHDGRWEVCDSAPVTLHKASHCSYPHVFAHEGDVFLIPETSALGRVDLFRARRLPHDWEFAGTILPEFAGLDPTILWKDGRLRLFAGLAGATEHRELHLFSCERLDGTWQACAGNPVVDGFSHARPAGPLFEVGDQLLRPAQDCRGTYGEAVRLMRIDALSDDHYRETQVARLGPRAWPDFGDGVHTLCCRDGLVAFDAKGFRGLKRLGGRLHAGLRRRMRA